MWALTRRQAPLWGEEERQGREGDVQVEAEVGVRQPPAQERLRGAGGALPQQPLEGVRPCQHLDFGLPASRRVRE